MLKGILDYMNSRNYYGNIFATDVKERPLITNFDNYLIEAGEKFDFLSDNYPYIDNIDYIIMNPPYSTIEPFTIKALDIAKKGVLLLGRIQFLEGISRYNNLFKEDNQLTDIYCYWNRIQCYKNGDFNGPKKDAQMYVWFFFDKTKKVECPKFHWISRKENK